MTTAIRLPSIMVDFPVQFRFSQLPEVLEDRTKTAYATRENTLRTSLPKILSGVGREFGADVSKGKVHGSCQVFHPDCRGQGDQSYHQRVLDQVLTVFVRQELQLYGQLQQSMVHSSLSL